jgi:hypothetical protein
MSHSGDEATLSLLGVKEKSDITVINEGFEISELEKVIQSKLSVIL